MHHLDTTDLARRYLAGESMKGLADACGVTIKVVKLRLEKAGVELRTQKQAVRNHHHCIAPEPEVVVRMYLTGESEKAIADSFGVSRYLIRGILDASGIQIRGRSDAAKLRMSRLSPSERLQLTEAAHSAVRGVPQSIENLSKSAATREALQSHRSQAEITLENWLRDKGVEVVPQKAAGPYNIDLALTESSVAVEIFGGHWHASGGHADRHRKRFDYLIDQGWLPIVIWVGSEFPLTREAAHYVIAWHDARCYHKSPVEQEHMIRGDGHGGPVVRLDADGRPFVPGTKRRTDIKGRDAIAG